jgi:Domain of unknown function (DUF5011)/FG-GAP-like repeat
MKHLIFVTLAIGSLFTIINAACGGPFALSDVVTNSRSSYFVAIGDLNGDGKPDLVSADSYSSFTIATNAGGGIFVSNATYNVGNSTAPTDVAIADINGDGKPDIITRNIAGTVTIFTNAGGGIFVSNATYAVGSGPYFIVVTDINGDGKPDIIVANNTGGTLTILTNAGGTFPVAQKVLLVNSNSDAGTFTVADLNGDGKPDLIVGDYNNGLIETLTNAGGGIFVSNAVYPDPDYPMFVVAADFNNDGKMDIAWGNLVGTVNVFTNAGNGILAQSQSFTVPGYADGSIAIMAEDVDGDGHTDLLIPDETPTGIPLLDVVYNSGSGGIFITNFLNNSNVVNMVIPNFDWTAAADINGDGKPDFVGFNQAGPSGFFIYTNGIGAFPNSLSINVYTNTSYAPVTNIIAQATSLSGAVVNFITTATNWTGSWPVTNTPPSGSVFPIGTTTVTSSAGYHLTSVVSARTNITFTVTVQDTQTPVITLLGANPLTNFVDAYSDPGATATDPIYGNLTGSIIVSGNLNTNVPGNYTVTYSVTDPSGNNAMTNRTVVIVPLPTLGAASAVGNQTAIFWPPGSDTNYVLQMRTNLNSGNWVNVTNSAPLMGVFVTNSLPAAFFRLQPQ